MNREAVLVVPGSIRQRTGGYIYDRRMVEGLPAHGWQVSVAELDQSFPTPTAEALDHARVTMEGMADGTLVIVDSLALGAMPDVVSSESARLRLVGLMHLPLAAARELNPDVAATRAAAEGRALRACKLVIVTGRATLALLERYDLPSGRVVVVEPGTDRAPLARGSDGARLELLTVATINAGKGHVRLLEVLARVPFRDWHLTCAGSLTRDPLTVAAVRAAIQKLGLQEHVTLAGDLDREALERCYDRADLFVLATVQETYGMAVAEAIAHGLPVVATATGAIPDLLADEAGLAVPVDDDAALEGALTRVMTNAALRRRLAGGARRQRARLPAWDEACARMAAALEQVAMHG